VSEADCRRDTEHFACRHIAHDDLLAVRGVFLCADVAVKQQKKGVSLAALLEDIGVLGVPDGACFPEQVVQFRGIESREEGRWATSDRSTEAMPGNPLDWPIIAHVPAAGWRNEAAPGDSPLNLR